MNRVHGFLGYLAKVPVHQHRYSPNRIGIPSKQLIILRIEPYAVLVDVCIQFIRAQNLGNLDKLIIVIMTMEERFLPENLTRENRELPRES